MLALEDSYKCCRPCWANYSYFGQIVKKEGSLQQFYVLFHCISFRSQVFRAALGVGKFTASRWHYTRRKEGESVIGRWGRDNCYQPDGYFSFVKSDKSSISVSIYGVQVLNAGLSVLLSCFWEKGYCYSERASDWRHTVLGKARQII